MAKVYWRLDFTLAPNMEAKVHFSFEVRVYSNFQVGANV